ncbi:MAG: TonB-dependent receptor, partial [Pseudomonadota bacterium]
YEQELRRNTGFPLNADGSVPEGIDTDTFTGLQNGIGEVDDTYVDAQIVHDFLDNLKLTVRGSYQRGNISYQNADGLYNFNNVDGVRGLSEANPFVYTFYGFAGDIDNEVLFFDAQLAYQAEMFGQTQDFVIGASYDDTSFERSFNSDTQSDPISLTDLDIPRVGPTTFTPLEPFDKTFLDLRSVFAETALRPKDWLTIVAGVRYDSLEQEGERRGFESLLEEDEVTFRLGASAAVVENLNVYLSFAEAFEPQGGRPQRSGEEVGPVLSTGYEAGLKGTLWNGRAGFEAAIFETTRENLAVADPNNAFGEDFQVTIGEIRLRGAEFSGNVALLDTLDWTVSLGLIDTDVLEAGDDEVTPPFLIPEFNASSFVTYEVGEGNLEGLKLGGGFRHYGDSENGTISNDAYTVADVNISYPIRDDITLSADILNVFDEFYLETGPLPIVTSANQLGQPRTAVITDRARF